MSKVIKKFSWRTVLIGIEVLAVVAVLLGIIVGVAAWRLSGGPLDIGFAKDYIEQALVDEERGTHVTINKLMLQWPDFKGPLILGLDDVQMIDANDKVMFSVDSAALSLSKRHLLIGRIAPTALSLIEPSVRVIRDENGEFDFGFSVKSKEQASEEGEAQQEAIVERILENISQPGQKFYESSPLSSLRTLRIENASFYFEDLQNEFSWALPNLNMAFENVEEGLRAELYLPLSQDKDGQGVASSYIEGNYTLNRETMGVNAYTGFENFDLEILADKFPSVSELGKQNVKLDAKIFTTLDKDLNPVEAKFSVSSVDGTLAFDDLSADPFPYQAFALNGLYDAQQSKLRIQDLKIIAKDVEVHLEASLKHSEDSVIGPIIAKVKEVKQSQIKPIWPTFLEGDSSEEWIVDKLSDGTFYDSFASVDLVAKKITDENGESRWDFDAQNIEAGFAFEGMSVDYLDPLFPATNVVGHGILDGNEDVLRIDIESGNIRDISIKKGELKFLDVIAVGKGSAEIATDIEGPVKTVIDYVSQEPIALEHSFDMNRLAGNAAMNVNIAFPTSGDIPIEAVKVTVNGSVNNALLPAVVEGLDLTGGPFQLSVKGNTLDVSGKGDLAGRPVQARYEAFLNSEGESFSSRINATLVADPNLRNHFGVDLSDFIEGSVPIQVVYTEYNDGRSQADVRADLTSAKAFVEPFAYEKPIGTQGAASLKLLLQNGIALEVQDLVATAPGLSLESTRLVFKQIGNETELSQGKISRFVIGETVGSLDFEIQPNGRIKTIMKAPFLDARPFLGDERKKDEPYDGPPMLISVSADRIRTGDEQTVQYGKIYIDIDEQGRFNQFEIDAIAGKGDVYLRYKPDASGKRVFRLEADDAGAALRAAGVYDQIQGGKLVIYGEPIRGVYDRNIKGVAEMTNFKVSNAPALAKLVGAMSLPGLVSSLNNEGLSFTKLESNFDWLYRQGGSLLVLKDGRTSGNSLGLTFDGVFDNRAGTVDVSGTLIPLSGINKMIGDIPLIGDILTGGTGSLVAATYTMKVEQKGQEPKVFVNPLSVLTPGILRRILFEQN